MKFKILTINPGSTSTKVAIFEDENEVFSQNIDHSSSELEKFKIVGEQLDFRLQAVEALLDDNKLSEGIHAVVGRGGFINPVPSGVYLVNEKMVADLQKPVKQHASNLGALIAEKIATKLGVDAYIVDPVVVDEMEAVAKISGYKGIERKSMFHPLNHKAVAKKIAGQLSKSYEEINLIIAHMGGGITVGAHKKGKVIDVNNGADGGGAFSPERAGGLPVGDVVGLCYSGRFSEQEMRKEFMGKGGMVSYFGTNDLRQVEKLAGQGNEEAKLVTSAMAYQVAKDIGAASAVLCGDVQAIGLTGGMANSKFVTDYITEMVKFIAPVFLFPGEKEMEAMAKGVLSVLRDESAPKEYPFYKEEN